MVGSTHLPAPARCEPAPSCEQCVIRCNSVGWSIHSQIRSRVGAASWQTLFKPGWHLGKHAVLEGSPRYPAHGDSLRGLGYLHPPFLPGAAGHREDALPLANLIDGPGLRLILVKRIRVFAGGIQVDRFRESFVEHIVQEAVGRKPLAAQGDLGEEIENVI